MARAQPDLQVLTANRLADGVVVFLDDHGGWATEIHEAAVATDAQGRAALVAAGDRDAAAARIVGPYLIGIARDGEIVPIELRERIRASGLTFRTIAAEAVAYL